MALAASAIGALLIAERLRPLRRPTRPALPRMIRNGAMGAACQAVIMVSEGPLTRAIARSNARHRRGLQHALGSAPGKIAAFLLMDYGFYLWHVATHRLAFLWRFHRVHHVDPDLDASTAIRFHFLDMLVSVPWRLVQVRASGASPQLLAAWQVFFLGSILFHHSNWRLPGHWDRRLGWLLTTPTMHGIHHSRVPGEMNSNWSSGMSWWDYLHRTFRSDVPQHAIAIGVDDLAAERDVALLSALAAPLRPAGGHEAERETR